MEEKKDLYAYTIETTKDWDKIQYEATLAALIVVYLQKLQGGKFGIPTMQDLNRAGMLHAFIENVTMPEDLVNKDLNDEEEKVMKLETIKKISRILVIICYILIPLNIITAIVGIITKDYFNAMFNVLAVALLYYSIQRNK